MQEIEFTINDVHMMVFRVDEEGNGDLVYSTLKEDCSPVDEDDDPTEFIAAIDGIESLLLAMVCEGIDLNTKQMRTAVMTAYDACANNL